VPEIKLRRSPARRPLSERAYRAAVSASRCHSGRGSPEVEKLAAFVVGARYQAISQSARQQLKVRVLDRLGCAIGSLDAAALFGRSSVL
jgi:hypothetical protein